MQLCLPEVKSVRPEFVITDIGTKQVGGGGDHRSKKVYILPLKYILLLKCVYVNRCLQPPSGLNGDTHE